MWPRLGPIPTYGVLYSISIISHFLVCYFIARRLKIRRRVWLMVGICYLVGMTIGAKALYDAHRMQFNLKALFSMGHYMQGGLWGGLLAYIGLAVPVALILAKNAWRAIDLIGLSIPVPWIFVKLACLFNGCCYGRKCSMPWAIVYPAGAAGAPAGIPLHPTQIYEILVMLCILVVFKKLNYERWRGTMLLWFLALYGLGRAATEIWRGDFDHHIYIGSLTFSQLICLAAAGISIVLLFLYRLSVHNTTLD
ncbi:MAG: prolipoprotein diacylglyceryl transferase [Phycisphaerales bacterium]